MLLSVMPVVCWPWHGPDAVVPGAVPPRPPQAATAARSIAVQPITDTRMPRYSFRRVFLIEYAARPASPARPVGATYITAMISRPKTTPGAASLTFWEMLGTNMTNSPPSSGPASEPRPPDDEARQQGDRERDDERVRRDVPDHPGVEAARRLPANIALQAKASVL